MGGPRVPGLRALGLLGAVATAPLACGPPAPAPSAPWAREPAPARTSGAERADAAPAVARAATAEAARGATRSDGDAGPVELARSAWHAAHDVFDGLPTGRAQRAALCARGHTDRVARAFCAEPPPAISGLDDLHALFDLRYEHPELGLEGNGTAGNAAFVLAGHSPALGIRLVSPVNPRLILFTPPVHTGASGYHFGPELRPTPDFVALAFTRGEQFVELVTRDGASGDLRFFVLRYEQRCNAEPGGCDAFALFSPETERDWRAVDLYDDRDLGNTVADCNVCHQPGGHGSPRVLLMQTRVTPWNHFFRFNRDGGAKLYGMFRLAHGGDEPYGGLSARVLALSNPAELEGLVENEGNLEQPVGIPARHGWPSLYERLVRGEIPNLGYLDFDTADEPRLFEAAARYAAVRAGRAPRATAPSFADLLRPRVRTHVGLAPPPGASGREILVSMCRRCHNPSRDPSLGRARFDVDALERLPEAELERAVERLLLPPGTRTRMPPDRLASLSGDEIARAVAELRAVIARRAR
ncbi:MAG: hypothetical protein IT373_04060 [Polyangiaceae bacterium]|nr:hypothetical protein [Polyangiaceae bacterium]